MNNYSLNKKIDLICILIIVALIILIIVNVININNNKIIEEKIEREREAEILNSLSYKGDRISEDVITPAKSYKFFSKYSGNISTVDAYNSFYNMANNIIPNYYKKLKNFTKEQINEYFIKNKKDIVKDLGIDKLEDFTELVQGINELTGENIEFQEYAFDENTIKTEGKVTSADLMIKYKDNKDLKINITLLEEKKDTIIKVKYIK